MKEVTRLTVQEKVKSKTRTVEEILAMVPDGGVICSGGTSIPAFFEQLHTIADRITKPITVFQGGMGKECKYYWEDEYKDKFECSGEFFGAPQRERQAQGGNISIIPVHLHAHMDRFLDVHTPSIVVLGTTAVDRHGYVRTPLNTPPRRAMDMADIVVACGNPQAPTVYGDNEISIDEIDFFIDAGEGQPMRCFDPAPSGETEKTIGEYVATLVEDGSTIQLGIGAIPDAVALAFMNKKDLGIHTEMITSSMADLALAGVITGRKKSLHRGKLVGGFASGSTKLVEYLTENPSVMLMPLEYVNHPNVAAQNYKFCSINTCIEIDLVGQVASETIGPKQFSGTGGQNDTAEGAIHAPGGKSIIAFASAITKRDGTRVSKIKSILTPGSVVTLSRNNIDFFVTEYGIAPMKARTIRQRVDNLIAIAHPDFREELRAEANKLMLW